MEKQKPQLGFGVRVHLRLLWVLSVLVFTGRCQDAEVMNILKKTIDAPSSFQWTEPDVCKWSHVTCNPGKRVTAIQIGNQNLQGTLPKELAKLTELERFECQDNALMGPFPYLPKSLTRLFIHNNNFSSIPNDFFKGMTRLREVKIDYNPFGQWSVPDNLKDCVSLQKFSAQNVDFLGTIPEFFGIDGPFPGLVTLALSGNFLEGSLPASFSGSSLENLLVNGQKSNSKLSGTLAVLHNMTSLKQIWANGNSFTGPIPDLARHDQLFDVNLRDNLLTGVVPPSFTNLPSLKVVNLTNNYFQGSPPVFQAAGVAVDNSVDKGKNQYCTYKPGEPCSPLVNALLSVVEPLGYPLKLAQSWEGNDPCDKGWLGIGCSGENISVVNFQKMGLSGTISPSFANLTSVRSLLLANNDLGGTIPDELTTMPSLQVLDVSNNHLYGKVPKFRKGVVVKFEGNPDIGKDKPSSTASNSGGSNGETHDNAAAIVATVVGIFFLLGIGILVLVMFRRKLKRSGKAQRPNATLELYPRHSGDVNAIYINREKKSPMNNVNQAESGGNMVISIQVLREVTGNFSEENVLGKGGFGTVYGGELHDGTKIAVKRMQSGMVGEKGLNEFMAEIAVLTKVRHRHLVALLGYCADGNERLLVYEYMPQGALSRHLFNWREEGLKPMEWKRRLTIALDVARGVQYLHTLAQQIFIHRDLKPSNILLGDDMRAKVSDFGLVRLAPEGKASFETRLAGTFGYLAPEYAATGRVTTKVDVYSFGVILMEMITGRKALDDTQPEENIQLVAWFRRMLLSKDSFQNVIDPTIGIDEETLASISTVAELAGHCCAREPYQRPDMNHAVNVLSPLVEAWKPAEPTTDDIYGIDFDMSLSEALKKWQAFEGTRTRDLSSSSSSSVPTSGDNTRSSIPTRPSTFAKSFRSSDGR